MDFHSPKEIPYDELSDSDSHHNADNYSVYTLSDSSPPPPQPSYDSQTAQQSLPDITESLHAVRLSPSFDLSALPKSPSASSDGQASGSSAAVSHDIFAPDEDDDTEGSLCFHDSEKYPQLSSADISVSTTGSSSCEQSNSSTSSKRRQNSSSAMLTTLKKRWKGVKRAGVKSTANAGKSISSAFSRSDPNETPEDRHGRLTDEWLTSILPSWHKKRQTARVRTLIFRGIPPPVRGRVWQCAIGNPLSISEELFDVLKERASTGRRDFLRRREAVANADGDVGGVGGMAEPMLESERSAHKAIMLDLPRTFPELSFFHAQGSHYEFALRDVLEAFLYLKPDVGYSQGMSFLAAVLLLYMDPFEAFSCFCNMLLHKSCFLHFFRIKMPEVRIYLAVHDKLLHEEMPSLYGHFKKHGIDSDLYMINWIMSLYCRALPLDLVTRIWDIYVVDGDVAIFRAALGLLRLFMSKLLKMKFEELAYFLSHIPGDEIEADTLIQTIRSVRLVTKKKFRDLFKECQVEHEKLCQGDESLRSSSKNRSSLRPNGYSKVS
ncbi:TBC1 domain family member 14 [Gracilariopsis chorda]|uniref:TBC1 domain family member 14 n=1 Tax=Gracilariopsis chorda TaxID=448386 RepID=A0A2V3IJQ3_9FLOR|nr:TBC1 domain family member 14 [Gracilariopsis chorda]|eukprot:PXF42307.1 TBC1 domain family member 14 [Gracilariopsis chorda]